MARVLEFPSSAAPLSFLNGSISTAHSDKVLTLINAIQVLAFDDEAALDAMIEYARLAATLRRPASHDR